MVDFESVGRVETKPKRNWLKTTNLVLGMLGRFLARVGGFLTPLAVTAVGFLGTQYLSEREAKETNIRLYADLMSRREQADSDMRKDMFDSVIRSFIRPNGPQSPEQAVLNLELLARNFHESLDLAPLFKQVYEQLERQGRSSAPRTPPNPLLARLEKVKDEVMEKQVETLVAFGKKRDAVLEFDELGAVVDVIDAGADAGVVGTDLISELKKKQVRLQVLKTEKGRRRIFARLTIGSPSAPEADKTFWIGPYDFPMLNNVRLPGGNRCAVVLRNFQEGYAEITLVLFPGSRASLKEKPYYDEVMDSLRRQERVTPDK